MRLNLKISTISSSTSSSCFRRIRRSQGFKNNRRKITTDWPRTKWKNLTESASLKPKTLHQVISSVLVAPRLATKWARRIRSWARLTARSWSSSNRQRLKRSRNLRKQIISRRWSKRNRVLSATGKLVWIFCSMHHRCRHQPWHAAKFLNGRKLLCAKCSRCRRTSMGTRRARTRKRYSVRHRNKLNWKSKRK